MPTNEKGENITGAYPDFSESLAWVYINQGPFMTNLNKDKMFDNAIDEVIAMEVHSSLDSFYRYGFVVIPDRVGFRETLSLTGNEIVTLRYGNSLYVNNRPPKTIHFNIYDIEEVAIADTYRDRYTNKALKLHLIEAPLFLLYNQKTWNKAYGEDFGSSVEGVKLNNIFQSHLSTDLKIEENNFVELDLLEMKTKMNWIIPSWKPQKTFSYLLKFAEDEDGYGNVKFFTSTDLDSNTTIINMKSIYQLFTNGETISYSIVNIGPMAQSASNSGETVVKTLNNLLNYKFESYDLTSLVSGLAGAYVYNRDYLNGQNFIQSIDYELANSEEKYFGNFGLWTNDISQWDSTALSIGSFPQEITRSYLENFQSSQKYQLKCIADSYLNHERNCGDKAFLMFPSGAHAIDESRTVDEQMSGTWVIQEIVDYITNNRGYSSLSFIKDSFFNTIEATTGNSKEKLPSVSPITNKDESTLEINRR